ncbi:lipopolysaccharide biosynthesis protein [Phreatobacter stygius]|uniref:Exopolysaccharide biosynthesis protein n=1 Tax=Phreatobacter stygius TaxID=1940610 RepID=A0A4D7B5X0_9HYPH|nr:polysaccharide biosynthesis C-terminal domain-containing protein [Phreatobacter stygius]QCI68411.1 exopolysaccharide biosynthesis protein [Phreatobacter stygius]
MMSDAKASENQERRADERATAAVSPEEPIAAALGDAAPAAAVESRELAQRLSNASVWALVVYVGGAALTTLAQLQIAWLIGVSGFGVYSYVFAWITLLGYSSTLGFNVALLRFVPAYGAKDQWCLARGVIRFALAASFATAVVVALVGAGIVAASAEHFASERASMLIGMAAVPLITMYMLGATLVRAFGGVVSALVPERIFRDGLLLALVGLAAMVTSQPLDAPLVMAALLVSSACTAALVAVTALRFWPREMRQVKPAYAIGEWWSSVLPIMIMTALDILISRSGVIVLGWTGNIRDAGIFALGFSFAMLLMLPRVAVSTIFAPTVAALHAQGDQSGLRGLFARASVLSLAGAAVLALPLLLLLEPLLRWFGQDFVGCVPIVQILVIGQVFAAAAGPQQTMLIMTGNERAALTTMIASAGLNIVGCVIGIALYGAIGAAVATTATMVFWNLTMAVSVRKHLGLGPGLAAAIARRRARARETAAERDTRPAFAPPPGR